MFFTKVLRPRLACALETLFVRHSVLLGCLVLALFSGAQANAARPRSQQPGATIVVSNDYGGSVRARYAEIQQINRLEQRVEIRGRDCISSCTMFLGVNLVCVSPDTSFGFHGPYRFFSNLKAWEFEEWSRVISAHYPPDIRSWYMKKARYSTNNILRVKGSELIRLGVPICP